MRLKLNWCPTFDLLQLCVTLVARATILTLTLICFLLLGLALDQVIGWALHLLNAPPSIAEGLSQYTLFYVLLIGSAGTTTSILVIIFLIAEDLRSILRTGGHTDGADSDTIDSE